MPSRKQKQLSIISLILAIATIFSVSAVHAQSPTTTASTAPTTTAAPTTTIAKPQKLVDLLNNDPKADRPKDCSKGTSMKVHLTNLDSWMALADDFLADDDIADAYGKEIRDFKRKILLEMNALPSWCKGKGTPTSTTEPLDRPSVLDSRLSDAPKSCANPSEVNAWVNEVNARIASLNAIDTPMYQQLHDEIVGQRMDAEEERDAFYGMCKTVNPAVVTTVAQAAKAPATRSLKQPAAASKRRRAPRTAPPATAAPARVKKVSLNECDCDWVEVRR